MWGGKSIAVVGGGVAGLTVARRLSESGAFPTVFEKARGPGGRMSTRRRDGGQFDHGAQYFTVRSAEFEREVQDWVDAGVVAAWSGDVGEWKPDSLTVSPPRTRWVGQPRMSALTRHLSSGLTVVSACRVVKMERTGEGWWLQGEDGVRHGPHDAVVLTCPGPQAAALAPQESRVQRRALSLKYTPCWAAMITVTEPLNGQLDGYACDHPVAAWIAHDSSKPGRPLPGRWVVHARAEWSAANEEASPADVAHALSAAFTEVVRLGVSEVQVHRWRYALAEPTGASTMMFEEDLGLGLCGDGLAGGKVEGAWQSAVDLVSHMNDRRG